MVDAAPFRALRYDPAVAGAPVATSAPAYDDLEPSVYARHRTASPYTVLELLAGAPADGDAPDYRAAGSTFDRWRRTGVFRTDETPAFYRYEEHELRSGVPTVQTGILAAVTVDDPRVLAHERVDPQRVQRRLERLWQVPADLSPVFAVYPAGPPALRELLARPPRHPPLIAFTDETGIDHRIWSCADPDEIDGIRSGLRDLEVVIADGHHRYAAAAAFGGAPGADRTLMYLVDGEHHGPQILPVHRVAAGVTGDPLASLDRWVTAEPFGGTAQALAERVATAPDRVFGLCTAAGSALLRPRDETAMRRALPDGHTPAWQRLDAALADAVLLPSLDATAMHHTSDAARAALDGAAEGCAALLLRAPSIEAVYACASADDPMPPKSTWFRPKPRTGLILRALG